MTLTDYRTLGRSGLIVSPLTLGTMTYGAQRWGSPDDVSEAIFNAYVDAGGNFFDSADIYAKGRSEELLGQYVNKRGLREQVVLATKFTWNAVPGVPVTSGNSRKNISRALDGSLKRLGTDYIDLYWLHHWDLVTPVEEVLQTLGDLVRAGRIRYFGFSNLPAWYAAQAATLSQIHGVPGPIALQLKYSLTERGLEREHAGAAKQFGLGITPWSPLAAGFLADKYVREPKGASGEGRLSGPNPFGDSKFTERNWTVLATLKAVAAELERPAAQLEDNLASLEVVLTPQQLERLDRVSALEPSISSPAMKKIIFGGASVRAWSD